MPEEKFYVKAYREITFKQSDLVEMVCRETNWPVNDVIYKWAEVDKWRRDDPGWALTVILQGDAHHPPDPTKYAGYQLPPEIRLLLNRKDEEVARAHLSEKQMREELKKLREELAQARASKVREVYPADYSEMAARERNRELDEERRREAERGHSEGW